MWNLSKQQVISAIEKIDKENLVDEDLLVLVLKYGDKFYSPLQIVNLAFWLANKANSEHSIYSIEKAINILENLNFEIIELNKIWKLGCHWGSGAPSFYGVIKEEKVVLDWGKFREGDLILITEGFTVRALGRILPESISDSEEARLRLILKNYSVFDDDINISRVEFYELPKVDVFAYELQQGIVNVRKKAIRFNSINLWINKFNKEPTEDSTTINNQENIEFRSYFYRNNSFDDWNYPCIGLRHLTNEKNGVRNSFQMTYFLDEKNRIEIGVLLIHMRNNYVTELAPSFRMLDTRYCSIGSTVDFYHRLKEILPNQYDIVLKNINDIARNQDVRKIFNDDLEMKKSLLTTSEAEFIINNFEEIISKEISDKDYNFSYEVRIPGANSDHSIDFSFQSHKELGNRFFCLVGKNATGKTKYISNLANKLADNNDEGLFLPNRPSYSKVIAASFSYFDKFRVPTKIDSNYEFIGIRNKNGVINEDDYFQVLWESFKNIVQDKEKFDIWFNSLLSTIETSHLSFDLLELQDIKGKEDFLNRTKVIFSSGQNIVFQFLTRFTECLEFNSLLIFDEPENHLHPNIVGRLLRTINKILIEYKSFAILATHSPIILQEIPSRFIRVIDRVENTPVIYEPPIECFGENLTTISNSIFKVDVEKELYKLQLDRFVEDDLSFDEVNKIFGNSLSLNARMYLLNELKSKND